MGGKPPRITISGGSVPQSSIIDHQLASTRIPLRSALLMQISEWWPLIPSNTDINISQSIQQIPSIAAITIATNTGPQPIQPSIPLLNQPNISISQQSLMNPSNQASMLSAAISTTTSNSSITSTVFFQKAPSMDHLGSRSGSGANYFKNIFISYILNLLYFLNSSIRPKWTAASGSNVVSSCNDDDDFTIDTWFTS